MNEYLSGFLLGLVQGLTEFLPVSSSGHLALLERLGVGWESVGVNLALHVATLLVVVVTFRKDIIRLASHPTSTVSRFLLLATVPTAICAGLIRYLLPDTTDFLPTAFMLTSVLLVLPAAVGTKRIDYLDKKWWKRALIVGLFQGAACINGVSRSGATVTAGRLVGMGEDAGRNSFLLSIPIIVGSAVVEGLSGGFGTVPVGGLIVGTLTAFFVGLFAIKACLILIKKNKFFYFSIYTFLLSIASFFLLF
ncbi:MAG: undecaprenyl-diphosphate phosphatase [Clostridia bacterium]|nr:undecaprenyl-diphosphate phosphatase [Clostridia bacterium]